MSSLHQLASTWLNLGQLPSTHFNFPQPTSTCMSVSVTKMDIIVLYCLQSINYRPPQKFASTCFNLHQLASTFITDAVSVNKFGLKLISNRTRNIRKFIDESRYSIYVNRSQSSSTISQSSKSAELVFLQSLHQWLRVTQNTFLK